MKTRQPNRGQVMRMRRHFIMATLLIGLLFSISACATMEGKFTKTTQADVSFFADNTLSMVNEVDFSFTKDDAIYTREFFVLSEPEEMAVIESRKKVERVLVALIDYSLKLVSIVEDNPTEERRIRDYASYLDRIDNEILKALDLGLGHYDALIKNVRSQDKFLGALRAAQPLIYAMGRYMHYTLEDMEAHVDALYNKVDRKIDARYADLIRYQETLEAEKYAVLAALEQVYLTSKGDMDAYNKLLETKHILSKKVIPAGKPTEEDLIKMVNNLKSRLALMRSIGEEIEPDWTIYRNTHIELDALDKQAKEDARKVRLLTIVWIRAHQKMASGKVNPAQWFDYTDAPAMLLKIGTKAIGL